MRQEKHTTQEQIDEMRREILRERLKMSGGGAPEANGRRSLRKRRPALRAAGWVAFAAVVLLLVSAIVSINLAKSKGEIPSLPGGFQLYTVESGSMEPTLAVGSVILCRKPKDAGSLREGDIVTFRTLSGFIVTHRIITAAAGNDGNAVYRTKGDNPKNSTDPEPLTSDRVIAVFVAKIPLT